MANTDSTNAYWHEYLEAIAKACGTSVEEVEKEFGKSLDRIATDILKVNTKHKELKGEEALKRIIRRIRA